MDAQFNPNYQRYEDAAAYIKGISHPVRICIIMGLNRKKLCNVTDMKCQLDLPQSTVSTHLAVLREIGVVEPIRQGTEMFYQLKDDKAVQILNLLGLVD